MGCRVAHAASRPRARTYVRHTCHVRIEPPAPRSARGRSSSAVGRHAHRGASSGSNPSVIAAPIPPGDRPASSRLSDCPARSRAWAPDAGAPGAGRSLVSRDARPDQGPADHPGRSSVDADARSWTRAHECHAAMEWQAACHASGPSAFDRGQPTSRELPRAPAARCGRFAMPTGERDVVSPRRHGDARGDGIRCRDVPAGSILRACRRQEPLMAGREAISRPGGDIQHPSGPGSRRACEPPAHRRRPAADRRRRGRSPGDLRGASRAPRPRARDAARHRHHCSSPRRRLWQCDPHATRASRRRHLRPVRLGARGPGGHSRRSRLPGPDATRLQRAPRAQASASVPSRSSGWSSATSCGTTGRAHGS